LKRLIPIATAVLVLAVAPAAQAAVDLSGGTTRLTVSKRVAGALGSLGVKVKTTGAASARGRHVRFPITGGRIDPVTAAGKIRHAGGIKFKAHGARIVLRRPTVRVGQRIMLSAIVGGSRVRLIELTGRPRISRSGFGTNVRGLTARLNRTAANALNATFGVHAFRRGLALGKVRVSAKPSATELLARGATALTIDPGALAAITGLGIAPGVIAPATLAGTTASFPITGGKAALDLSSALVMHSGGLSLTRGATVVALTDFDIRVGAAGAQLFGSVNGGAQKAALLDLDLSGVVPAVAGRTVTLDGVRARLTQGAAGALNGAFATNAFAGGLLLGVAKVTATGR
jgi:hypothetical protein